MTAKVERLVVLEFTGEQLGELFCQMDSEDMAEFFCRVAEGFRAYQESAAATMQLTYLARDIQADDGSKIITEWLDELRANIRQRRLEAIMDGVA